MRSVDELKFLGTIANSAGTDEATRKKALTNFNQLWNSIETSNLDASGNRGLGLQANGVRQKDAEGQTSYVQNKRQAINVELNKEKALLGDLAKQTEQRQTAGAATSTAIDALESPAGPPAKPEVGLYFKNTERRKELAGESVIAPTARLQCGSGKSQPERQFLASLSERQRRAPTASAGRAGPGVPACSGERREPARCARSPELARPEDNALQKPLGRLRRQKPASQNANQTAVFNTARGNELAAQDKETARS